MKSENNLQYDDKYVNKIEFIEGFRDGIPIGLGYFAVAFSLGIIARDAGMSGIQGFFASLFTIASAGEYVGFSLMKERVGLIALAFAMLVTNARYILMSCALSQHFSPETKLGHRFLVALGVTDEIFGISIARKGWLNPYYNYGAIVASVPLWAIGTSCGIIAGNILPIQIVSALSVALYGMFLAIIIPPSKENRIIGVLVIICFCASYLCSRLPVISSWASGNRTILLTVMISAVVAVLFPVKEMENE
ncbi:MAG: AzlC family ABC transporter permease [Lachnospiraceae bacterium]